MISIPLLFVINFAVIYYIQARSPVSPDILLIYSIFEIKSVSLCQNQMIGEGKKRMILRRLEELHNCALSNIFNLRVDFHCRVIFPCVRSHVNR